MGRKRKSRTHKTEEETFPRSIVIQNCSNICPVLKELVTNTKSMLEPFVMTKLRQKSSNSIKDFTSMAGPLNCGHIWVYNMTDKGLNLKISRTPQGPTLSFKVLNLAAHADLARVQSNHKSFSQSTITHPPIIIFNNFDGSRQLKLAKEIIQGAFPPINLQEIVIKQIKRVLLFHHDHKEDKIFMRHYFIDNVDQTDSGSFVSAVTCSNIDIGKFGDISDAISSISQSTKPKSGLKLTEIGPKLDLELHKIVENVVGTDEGEVVYNKFVTKSAEEKSILRQRVHDKKILKERRKQIQLDNLDRKIKKVKFSKI
eukprot:NODE_178_length_14069_cov_0.746815.p5 type:complete len:313 gc:universal NODE_178_length_14069_cov_0.746815:13584-12646(-)